jgi:hypothetical protein
MGTQENGIANNIAANLPAALNISSSTNTSPIVITTSANHGLTTGDSVDVFSHQTNTAANGIWDCTVTALNKLSLNGSVGNGVGVATGQVQSLALGPTFLIPADGVDNLAAASVNVPFNALADRTAFLARNLGNWKVVAFQELTRVVDSSANCFSSWDSFTPPVNSGTASYVDLASATIWTFVNQVVSTPAGTGLFDIVTIDVDVSFNFSNGSGPDLPINISLWVSNVAPGAADSFSLVTGRAAKVFGSSPSFPYGSMRLSSVFQVGTGGSLKAKLRANTTQANIAGTGAVLQFIGDYSVRFTQYREVSFSQ